MSTAGDGEESQGDGLGCGEDYKTRSLDQNSVAALDVNNWSQCKRLSEKWSVLQMIYMNQVLKESSENMNADIYLLLKNDFYSYKTIKYSGITTNKLQILLICVTFKKFKLQ